MIVNYNCETFIAQATGLKSEGMGLSSIKFKMIHIHVRKGRIMKQRDSKGLRLALLKLVGFEV
jgi:hypothetical protein